MDPGAVYDYFSALQERIVSALEVVDRKGFTRDSWQRAEGGGGTTCIVEDGQVFERAGAVVATLICDGLLTVMLMILVARKLRVERIRADAGGAPGVG